MHQQLAEAATMVSLYPPYSLEFWLLSLLLHKPSILLPRAKNEAFFILSLLFGGRRWRLLGPPNFGTGMKVAGASALFLITGPSIFTHRDIQHLIVYTSR
jgi:hypothetical protein